MYLFKLKYTHKLHAKEILNIPIQHTSTKTACNIFIIPKPLHRMHRKMEKLHFFNTNYIYYTYYYKLL